MAMSYLRVFHGPEDTAQTTSVAEESDRRNEVSVPLRDVLRTLADAVHSNRGWVRDFENDERANWTKIELADIYRVFKCEPINS